MQVRVLTADHADRPLDYADLLRPGEKIPAPKKVRRKGRAPKL